VPEFHYVSSVKGHLVTRFPSLRLSVAQYIGATRKGKTIVWDETEVAAISEREWQTYRREYRRCMADKSLVERTKEDFEAYVADKQAREKEALEKTTAEAMERAKAEAREQAPSTGTTNQPTEVTSLKAKKAIR